MIYNPDKLIKEAALFQKEAEGTVLDALKVLAKQLKNTFYGLNWSYSKTIQENPNLSSERAFQSIKEALPQLVRSVSELEKVSDISQAKYHISNIEKMLGGVLFFTSSGNAGTGFDERTKVKPSGGMSVSQLCNIARNIVGKLNKFTSSASSLENS